MGISDGTNGTPNLLDKFVMGVVNSTTNPGASGGAKTVTLSVANIPAHSHTSAEHTHTLSGVSVSTAGDHVHSGGTGLSSADWTTLDSFNRSIGGTVGIYIYNNESYRSTLVRANGSTPIFGTMREGATSANSAGGHTHSITGSVSSTTPGNTGSVGSGTAFSILPPYYALAFIMKM